LDNGTLEFPLTKGDDNGIIANLALNREGEEYSCNVFIPTEKDFTLPGTVRGSAGGALASRSQRRHTLEHILEALDAVIRHDVLVGFRALVRINENIPDADQSCSINIAVHVVSHPDHLARVEPHVIQRFTEEARVRFPVAMMAGNDH